MITSTETWDEMEARHQQERRDHLRNLVVAAHERGKIGYQSALSGDGNTLADINARIAARYEISPEMLRSTRRDHATCKARFHAFHLAREAGYSFPQIGRFYKRDHTTVMHGLRVHEAQQEAVQ